MDELAKYVARQVGRNLLRPAPPQVKFALAVTAGVRALEQEREKQICEDAQSKLECSHIEVCDGLGPPAADLVAFAVRTKGCAFLYRGVPLGHCQSDLDVEGLSPRVIRYDPQSGTVGFHHRPTFKCRHCHPPASSK